MPESTLLEAPVLPQDAPFSPEQREWLDGFLASVYAQFSELLKAQHLASAPIAATPITVLWGSQTGTCETLAKKFSKIGKKSGLGPNLIDLADYPHEQLAQESHVIIITSTYGDGEPPDNAADFYQFLHSDAAPKLETLNYSVLAIGDSSYPDFCKCGIDIDQRLQKLGAKKMFNRIDCDVDFEEQFATWTQGIIDAMGLVSSSDDDDDDEDDSGINKKNPLTVKVVDNRNLNLDGSIKETRHVALSFGDAPLVYEAGDALGVYPVNCPDQVDEILAKLQLDGAEAIVSCDGLSKPLRQALLTDFDIGGLNKKLVENWTKVSKRTPPTDDYLEGRELIDLIKDYPIHFSEAQPFAALMKKVNPRLYSISSSPKAHPGEVHLTVGAVRYESNGRPRKGVCSTYLADRTQGEFPPRVFVHANKAFRPPADPNVPMIMVGPGTGIAPFIAFLQERQATQASGKNWLFFGNPHSSTDFLYQEQLEDFQKEGILNQLSTAFSRDQEEKIYVQNRIVEEAPEIFQWLEQGAHFYVCGDASRMAKDVDYALYLAIQTQGNMSGDEASAYLNRLKKEKRYCRDVY
ncbi:MAG: flavodoxin domain-containing protein [Verrucomicrobiales bacterium]|nr:flavodoxin domain-containing protein [Verrucomicrobiales bacterium]